MAKSLLILMLVTTQLAAAGRGSVYLCIDGSGEYCCLDAGPESCDCCRHVQQQQPDACCEACEHEHPGSPSQHESNEKPQPCDGSLVAGDSCGCTHIPVVQSSAESRSAVRPSLSTNIEMSVQLMAVSATLSCVGDAIARPPLRWADPPAVPNFAQTVLSTVVIRC
jgi:hypothetical protein